MVEPFLMRQQCGLVRNSRVTVMSAILAGVIEWFGFVHHIWWLVVLSMFLLLRAVDRPSLRVRFIQVGLTQGTFFLLYVRWVSALGIDAWIALSTLCVVPWLLFAIPRFDRRGFIALLFPAAVVTLIEYLHNTIPWGGFPWGNLAYSQLDGPLIGLSQLGGQPLVSASVMICAVCAYRFSRRWRLRYIVLPMSLSMLASFTINSTTAQNNRDALVSTAIGAPADYMTTDDQSRVQRVLIVQGNAPAEPMSVAAAQQEVFASQIQLTSDVGFHVTQGASIRPNLVLWPENSTDIDPLNNSSARTQLQTVSSQIAAPILIGGVTWGGTPYGPRNEGIMWMPHTGAGQRYAKQHLVPFGEYLPLRSFLGRFIHRFDQINTDFIPGTHSGIFHLGSHLFGDLICFEIAYNSHVRELTQSGAQFITLQTNNATYRGRGQADQQFTIARFRAVEHNRDIAVASTTGFSGFITSRGTVLQRSAENQSATLTDTVTVHYGLTYADRHPFTTEQSALVIFLISGYRWSKRRRSQRRIGESLTA